jgi:hypothetical protein
MLVEADEEVQVIRAVQAPGGATLVTDAGWRVAFGIVQVAGQFAGEERFPRRTPDGVFRPDAVF